MTARWRRQFSVIGCLLISYATGAVTAMLVDLRAESENRLPTRVDAIRDNVSDWTVAPGRPLDNTMSLVHPSDDS
ncbi:MAG: hypothetical protein QGG36_05460 [Pirellulaceae bacterium]|nr:hypothetical protein [Pirellulaceae bacterium]MDP7015222.1 hypothetical protein [Pirellulaceae bacterium]